MIWLMFVKNEILWMNFVKNQMLWKAILLKLTPGQFRSYTTHQISPKSETKLLQITRLGRKSKSVVTFFFSV